MLEHDDPVDEMNIDNPIDPGHICALLMQEHEKAKFKCNIGSTHVGGCDDLYAAEAAGKLDALLFPQG